MEYTKGEWEQTKYEGCSNIRIGAVDKSQGYESDNHIAYVDGAKETEANAQLISAAPDLYEALKALVLNEEECGIPEGQAVIRARQALAKADS